MTNKHCTQCGSPCPEEALFCSQCGNALHRADRDPLIGQTIAARYHLVERIGQGGAGTLYRAEHVTLRRRMAVKLLHHQLSANEEAVERFRREAITVCEIDNDHILQVHDFGRADDGRLFFAMEYLEGEPLSALLEREGALSFERSIDVMGQIADGLMEAHALGYVHRDLRPRNVFLTRRRGKSDFVKLLDFGLSKLVQPDSDAARTAMGMTFGNPQYMAPEQARGEVVDRRADIYSLGAIGFEMLTGQPPFRGSGTFDILSKVLDAPVPRVRELRPDCPEWLESVVRVSLAKSAADRFATVAQVVEALERKQVLERQPPLTIQVGPLKDKGALMEKMTPMTAPPPEAPATQSKPANEQPAAEGKQGGRQTRAYEAVKLDEAPQSKGGAEEGRGQRLTRKERREQERRGKQTRLEIKPLDMSDRKAREAAARQIAEQAEREAAQVEELQREAAARKRAEEEAAARKKAEEEAARKRAEEEAARKKAEEEAAARRKAEEEAAARKRAEEEAARKKAEEEAARKKAEEEVRRRDEVSERAKAAARIMHPSARSPSPVVRELSPAEQAREPSARVAMDREAIAKEAAAWEEAAQQLLSMAEADVAAPASAVPEPIQESRPHLVETLVAPAPRLAETLVAPAPHLAETLVAPAPRLDEDATIPMPRAEGEELPNSADREIKTAPLPTQQLHGENESTWFDSEATEAAGATAIEEYEPEKRRLPAMAGAIAAGVALLALGSLVLLSKGKRPTEGAAVTNSPVTQPAPAPVTQPAPAPVTQPAPAPVAPPASVTPSPAPAPTEVKPPETAAPLPTPAPAPAKEPAAPPAKEPATSPPAPAKEPVVPSPAKEPAAAKPAPAKEPATPPPAPAKEPAAARPAPAKEPATPPPAPVKEPAAARPAPVKPAAAKEPAKAAEPPAKKPAESTDNAGDKKEEVEELLQAGRQKLQGGDVSGAAASFGKAKDLDARSAEAFAGLGEVAFEQGNWDDAVQKLQKAIKLSPRRASYQVLLGQSLYKLGRYKDAAEACRKALKLDPSLREAQQTLEAAEKKLDLDE